MLTMRRTAKRIMAHVYFHKPNSKHFLFFPILQKNISIPSNSTKLINQVISPGLCGYPAITILPMLSLPRIFVIKFILQHSIIT